MAKEKKQTEKELQQQLIEIKKANAELAAKEIDAICKKYNVVLVTNVDVKLNGQSLAIQVKPL